MLRLTFCLCVLAFAFLAPNPAGATVLSGPVTNPANGHAYYLLNPATWTDSQAEAVRLGGNLATINDAAENAWVVSHFSNFGGTPRNLWIGLTDAAQEGHFTWVSGEPVTYTQWGEGEPNDFGGRENWACILQPGDYRHPGWNDAPDVVNPYAITNGVVEVAVPEPGSLAILLAAAAGVGQFCGRRRSTAPATAPSGG